MAEKLEGPKKAVTRRRKKETGESKPDDGKLAEKPETKPRKRITRSRKVDISDDYNATELNDVVKRKKRRRSERLIALQQLNTNLDANQSENSTSTEATALASEVCKRAESLKPILRAARRVSFMAKRRLSRLSSASGRKSVALTGASRLRKAHFRESGVVVHDISPLPDKPLGRIRMPTSPTKVIAEDDMRLWTDVYRPHSSDEFIGNAGTVDKLKMWLKQWQQRLQKKVTFEAPKNNGVTKRKRARRDSEDDWIDDGRNFDDDDDRHQQNANCAIIFGPTGTGKTCLVYALAQELGFEVIEINCSSQRTSKHISDNFSGATQTHRMEKITENGKLKVGTSSKIFFDAAAEARIHSAGIEKYFSTQSKQESIESEVKTVVKNPKPAAPVKKGGKPTTANGIKKYFSVTDATIGESKPTKRKKKEPELFTIQDDPEDDVAIVDHNFNATDADYESAKAVSKKSIYRRKNPNTASSLENGKKSKRSKVNEVIEEENEPKLSSSPKSPLKKPAISASPASENSRSKRSMSIILFDDVDVIFESDTKFWSAVREIVDSALIPVVLTCTDSRVVDTISTYLDLPTEPMELLRVDPNTFTRYFRGIFQIRGVPVLNDAEFGNYCQRFSGDFRACLLAWQFYSVKPAAAASTKTAEKRKPYTPKSSVTTRGKKGKTAGTVSKAKEPDLPNPTSEFLRQDLRSVQDLISPVSNFNWSATLSDGLTEKENEEEYLGNYEKMIENFGGILTDSGVAVAEILPTVQAEKICQQIRVYRNICPDSAQSTLRQDGFVLDYLPALRNMASGEKNGKTANRRFRHYFHRIGLDDKWGTLQNALGK